MESIHLPGTVGLLVCSLQVTRRRPGLEEIRRIGRQAEEYDEGGGAAAATATIA